MLVKFKVENWKSFHCLDFSAIASSKRRFNERVPKVKNYRLRLLPISAVFGGNASGKTNFFDALVFLQKLVRGEGGKFVRDEGVERTMIDVKPFAFNTEDREKPVSFEIEFLVKSKIYNYKLTLSRTEVLVERLAEVCYDGSLKVCFGREREKFEFFGKFKTDRMGYVGQGTQNNILFLTNSVQQQCEEFRDIYDWFDKTLLLISPRSGFVLSRELLHPKYGELLDLFDVGFDELAEVDLTLEQMALDLQNKLSIPKEQRGQFRNLLKLELKDKFFNSDQERPIKAKKIVAMHTLEDDSEKVAFELEEESDGTRRLLNLLPALVRLRDSSQSSVVFIDELDRSMHHLLTKKLIEAYLDECSPESRTQLFFTTHDALLLDEDLLRRDEMWLVERNDGVSELMSIGDFKINKGQNLLYSYLYGCFGGVPRIR